MTVLPALGRGGVPPLPGDGAAADVRGGRALGARFRAHPRQGPRFYRQLAAALAGRLRDRRR